MLQIYVRSWLLRLSGHRDVDDLSMAVFISLNDKLYTQIYAGTANVHTEYVVCVNEFQCRYVHDLGCFVGVYVLWLIQESLQCRHLDTCMIKSINCLRAQAFQICTRLLATCTDGGRGDG